MATKARQTKVKLDDLLQLKPNNSGLSSDLCNQIRKEIKQLYISENHPYKIGQLKTKNRNRAGHWYTHIYVNNRRTTVEKSSLDDLYDYLFNFYKSQETNLKTFDDIFDLFCEYKKARGRSLKTLNEYHRYNAKIPESIRSKNINSITEEELAGWLIDDFLTKKPKRDTLKKMILLLKAVFTYGIRIKYCTINPALSLCCDDYYKYCNLTSKINEQKSFSDKEIALLKKHCLEDQNNPHAAVMLTAIETGMRVGELTALMKEDIKDGFIYVHRQQIKSYETKANMPKFKVVNYTKNERTNPKGGRLIPITNECYRALEIAFALPGESEYVFHQPDGCQVLKESYMKYLRKNCRKLGIKTTNNHAFRIAFNARLIAAGLDGNERCLILGHSMQTNERHYSFSDRRKAEEIKEKLLKAETS